MTNSRGLLHAPYPQRSASAPQRFPAQRRLRDSVWLAPSLAAGAIAARVVGFVERRVPTRDRRGRFAPATGPFVIAVPTRHPPPPA